MVFTSSDPEVSVKIRYSPGCSGLENIEPDTVIRKFRNTVWKYGDLEALKVERTVDGKEDWVTWTWRDYYRDVIKFAKSVIHVGVPIFGRVSIIGFNAPEWLISDLGSIFSGTIPVGFYTTSTTDACEYLLNHSKAEICVVENDLQLQKILPLWDKLPNLKAVVQYIGKPSVEREGLYQWDDFMKLGEKVPDQEVENRVSQLTPGHCVTLIYTSGTTGSPKAVMLSHDNIIFNCSSLTRVLTMNDSLENPEHCVSYLPLSHIAAQMLDIYIPMFCGGTVWFARPDALKGTLLQTLKKARPTAFFGVPRVWEKFAEALKDIGAQQPAINRMISTWAKGVGLEAGLALQRGESTPLSYGLVKGIFAKIKQALGFERCRYFMTGAAPISLETLHYFLSLDIPIYEVYGMSESSGASTCGPLDKLRSGTCGCAAPGQEVVIQSPDAEGNGEICMRGRGIFMGYLFNEKSTFETIDSEGFLHSGDIGRLDSEGRLLITGRLKEILITAGGENVAPVPIEEKVKEKLPFISNCMLVGDKKKFLSMLLTLKVDVDPDSGLPTQNLTQVAIKNINGTLEIPVSDIQTVEQVRKNEKILKFIHENIEELNKHFPSSAASIRKWIILSNDFSIPGEELGPTLKLRRNIVLKKYDDQITNMYEESKL